MRLSPTVTRRSPDDPAFLRIGITVTPAAGERFEIWFEVSDELEGALSDSGNAWLLAALPYALDTGGEIVCELPVDPELLENIKGLTSVWNGWYPQFRRPTVRAPRAPARGGSGPRLRTAAFFSGGVDSWFTVLRHAPEREPAAIGAVDDLITVHGFDIPVHETVEFAKLHATLASAAAELDRRIVVVRTNLRRPETLWARAWGWLTHGAGLAAAALILEKRYDKVLIGSTHPFGGLIPWGSHPMTDALLSTSGMSVKHDGASFNRVEKTALIARHAVALRNLHVCWKDAASSNCGRCAKCQRTLATLHLLGAPTGAFPVAFEAERLAKVFIENDNEQEFFREVLEFADASGNAPVHSALTRAMRRSRRLRPIVGFADGLHKLPLLWRVGHTARRLWLDRA